ncbi:hypothetical protein HBH51_249550 [Parastagonospora nodorum]|nr:hypothetical protein HBH51_249550 [Parastagonospora nodorum]
MRLIIIDRISLVIDTLTVTPIKDNDNLLNTIDLHIKLRKLKEVMLLCWIIKSLSIPSADKYSKKYLKVCEADALKQVDANVREEENKNCSSLYYSNSNSDTATRKTRIKASQLRKVSEEEELAKTKKEKREKELDSLLDSDNYCSDSSLDINSKDDLEDEEATTAKDLAREQKERLKALLNAKTRDSLSARRRAANAWKNEVVAIDLANSTWCNLSDPLALQFCFFSNSPLENIGRLTKEEAIEMRIDTTNAISKALAAANKLVALQSYIILEANTPAVHSKATKHRLAPSAAQFVIVCGFGKVDKHVFRAYNTISVTAQRTIIRKGSSYGRTIFDKFHNCKLEGTIIAKFYQDIRSYNYRY